MTLTKRHKRYLDWRNYVQVCAGVVTLLCVLFLSSCKDNSKIIYTDFVDIPTGGWNNKEFCEFETALTDSAMFADQQARYNLILTVRHTAKCPYNELFLPAVQSEDSCTSLPDTLHIVLADKSGTWQGKQSKGIYTLTDTILTDTQLPPLYSLRLYHAMPCENLAGLISIGLTIEQK